jgi:hypothetical protein
LQILVTAKWKKEEMPVKTQLLFPFKGFGLHFMSLYQWMG